MRRHAAAIACLAAAVLGAAAVARADEAEAEKDWTELEAWLGSQSPKNDGEKKAYLAEAEKRLASFVEKHAKERKLADPARVALAKLCVDARKFDRALALYEELARSEDPEMQARGRFGAVRTLIEKRDLKAARARLDAEVKAHKDDENLPKLEEHLKKLEGIAARGAALKKGASAPALAGKTLKGEALRQDDLAGKVLVVDFFRSDAAPCREGAARLKKVHARWREKGLEVVTVALDADETKLAAALEKLGLPWTVVAGEDAKEIARQWGVRSIPSIAVVGKDGKLVAVALRADKGDEVEREVEGAITGKKPKRAVEPDEGEGKGHGDAPGLGLEGG